MTENLQIVSLRAENVLGIKSADLEPDSASTEIFGDNGTGKTSLASSFRAAFKGLPVELIRRGASEAEVLVRLRGAKETYEIHRKRTAGGQRLTVKDGRGEKMNRPAEFLSGLLGDFSFDPGAFAIANGREQIDLFCSAFPCDLMGPNVDELLAAYKVKSEGRHGFVVLQELEEAIEENRRAVGVTKREAEAVAKEFEPSNAQLNRDPEGLAAAKSDLDAARVALGAIHEANDAIEARNSRRSDLTKRAVQLRQEITAISTRHEREALRLEDEIDRLKKALAAAEKERVDIEPVWASEIATAEEAATNAETEAVEAGLAEEMKSVEAAEEAVHEATAALQARQAHEKACDSIDRWNEKLEIAKEHEEEWDRLDDILNRVVRGEMIRNLWRQVPTVLSGLSLAKDAKGKDCLAFQSDTDEEPIPLSSVNTARKIEVGVKIAAALNKDYPVKVLAVDDAEHLTRRNRERLVEYAEAEGFQVLLFVAMDPEDIPAGELEVVDGHVRTVGAIGEDS